MREALSFLIILFILSSCDAINDLGNTNSEPEKVIVRDTVIIEKEITKAQIKPYIKGLGYLYRNCSNEISVEVPEEAGNTLKLAATNATVAHSPEQHNIIRITPSTNQTTLTGNITLADGPYRWSDEFKVIEPPKPSLEFRLNGKTSSGTNVVSRNTQVAIRVAPDEDFRALMPGEARYRVGSIDVLAQFSLGPPTVVNRINTAGRDATKALNTPLGTTVRQVKPGTTFYVRLNDIYRINYLNEKIEDKRFSEVERTFSFVVK